MADVVTRFRMIDEMSERLGRVAEAGQDMADQMQRSGDAANRAFNNMETGCDSTARSADGVARSMDDVSQANGRAANSADDMGRRSGDAIQNLQSLLAAAGLAKMVSEVTEAFKEASAAAAEFETATMKISTIADTTKVPLEQISGDIMELSRETGQSVGDLSEATYSALSASVDTASAVEFTGTATKLATGGFTSSATAVDVLTTALNAYGLEASEAGSISDMLITTQNLGKTTVDELAASVGKVIPLASAYGVEMDNLSAAYAELTKGGIATAEAGTYLKAMLNELGDSASAVTGVLLEETGMTFAQLTEQGYSLGDVMAILGESVNGDAGAFNELWSSSEAGIGALSLYNAGAEQFNTTLDAMQGSIGATDAAYSAMTDTTEHAQEEMTNAANNLKVAIGSNINPMVESMMNRLTDVLNWMSEFTTQHPMITKAISAITIGVTAFGVALGVVTVAKKLFFAQTVANTAATVAEGAASGAAVAPIMALGSAINAALGPIGWVVAGVTALTAAIGAFIAMNEEDLGEVEGMTATTREQYYAVQDLNAQYEEAVAKHGENSEQALQLKYQLDELNTSFEANRQTVEQFTAECDNLSSGVSDLATQFDQNIAAIDSEETGTLALIQRLEDLTSQSELTGAQQKELEAITNKLAEAYPELGVSIESITENTDDMVAAMKEACEQQAEQQRLQEAQDTYIDALAKREELTEKIAEAEENINLEQQRMDDMSGWSHFWTSGEYDDLDAYKEALEELQAAEEENNSTIADIEQQWQDIADKEAEAAEESMTYEEAVSTAFETVQTEMEELCQAYDDAYNAAYESFEGQFGLFDEASMKSEEYSQSTVANAQEAMDSQLAYWENYNANLETLTAYGEGLTGEARANYEELLAFAQDGSEEAAGLAQSMAEAISSGDEEAINKLSETVGKVSEQKAAAAAEVADWQTNFNASMDELVQKMNKTVGELNLDSEAKASAKSTIDAYTNQIRSSGGAAVAAAQSIANQVSAALRSANTNVSVGVSAPGHAAGTTNAEDVFVAGEEGPELIMRKVDAYATGSTDSASAFIAGDNGPELIVGQQGSTVFPASETDKIISAIESQGAQDRTDGFLSALDERQRPLNVQVDNNTSGSGNAAPRGAEGAGEQVKRIILEIAGSGSIDVGGGGNAETVLGILQDNLKPVLMRLIQGEIYEEGEMAYEY